MTGQLSNIPASIRARLLDGARQRGDDFNLVLQRYAAERFLYRLGESRHRERFVLKGAMLFALWGGSFYRATRDLDFAGYGDSDPESFIQTIREICAMSFPGDGIEFDPDSARAEPIRDDTNYGGYRVRLEARLDTANITLQNEGFLRSVRPQHELCVRRGDTDAGHRRHVQTSNDRYLPGTSGVYVEGLLHRSG